MSGQEGYSASHGRQEFMGYQAESSYGLSCYRKAYTWVHEDDARS